MKLLFIHNEYRRLTGEEAIFYSIVRLLRERGHDVRTFVRRSADLPSGLRGQIRGFFSGIWSTRSADELRAMLNEFRPDLVQVQNIYPIISPSILSVIAEYRAPFVFRCANYRLFCPTGLMLRNGKPCHKCAESDERWCVIHNCEGSVGKSVGYALRNRVARPRFLSYVHQFIVLSNFQRARFLEWGVEGDRISVVPNFVERGATRVSDDSVKMSTGDDSGCSRSPDRPVSSSATSGDSRYVAFVGRMSAEKGIAVFFEAARRLPQVQFRCAGNMLRMPLEAGAVPSNVEILGEIPRGELGRFYGESEFVIVPSIWYETFGLVTVEAMLEYRAVVASRTGALADIVGHEVTGLLVEPGNADELAAAIRRLWNNPAECRRMGEAGRVKAIDQYSSARFYETLMVVYQRAQHQQTRRTSESLDRT